MEKSGEKSERLFTAVVTNTGLKRKINDGRKMCLNLTKRKKNKTSSMILTTAGNQLE